MKEIRRTVARGVTQDPQSELQASSSLAVAQNISRAEIQVNGEISAPTTFFRRLFPTKEQRAVAEGKLQLIKTESDFRVRALNVVRETQLQQICEVFTQMLTEVKVANRQRMAELVISKQHELHTTFNEEYGVFIPEMVEAYRRADEIEIPFLREQELDRLDDVVIKFRESHDAVIANFARVTHEQITG